VKKGARSERNEQWFPKCAVADTKLVVGVGRSEPAGQIKREPSARGALDSEMTARCRYAGYR